MRRKVLCLIAISGVLVPTMMGGTVVYGNSDDNDAIVIEMNSEDGYHYYNGLEGLVGPNDFAVGDETIALLNPAESAVYIYSDEGVYQSQFSVSNAGWLTSIVWYQGAYYMSDASQRILCYSATGEQLEIDDRFCDDWSDYLYALRVYNGSLYTFTSEKGAGVLKGTEVSDEKNKEVITTFDDVVEPEKGVTVTGSYIGTYGNNQYYLVDALQDEGAIREYTLLAVYNQNNKLVGKKLIDDSANENLIWHGLNQVKVTEQGEVYIASYYDNRIEIEKTVCKEIEEITFSPDENATEGAIETNSAVAAVNIPNQRTAVCDGYASTASLVSKYNVVTWGNMCKGDYILMRTDVDGNADYDATSKHVVVFYQVPTSGYVLFIDSSLTAGKTSVRSMARTTMIANDYVPCIRIINFGIYC